MRAEICRTEAQVQAQAGETVMLMRMLMVMKRKRQKRNLMKTATRLRISTGRDRGDDERACGTHSPPVLVAVIVTVTVSRVTQGRWCFEDTGLAGT